jgi:hypothetical protein
LQTWRVKQNEPPRAAPESTEDARMSAVNQPLPARVFKRKPPSYEVKEITGHRVRDGQIEYRILWTVDNSQTWEPAENVDRAGEELAKFHQENGFLCRHCGEVLKSRGALRRHMAAEAK